MSELRKDSIVERWVIIAEDRAARPQEFVERAVVSRGGDCPFCEGSEHETPGEIAAVRGAGSKPNESGWQVRVVANKFPALDPIVKLTAVHDDPIFARASAVGAHEVIIESPQHAVCAADLTVEQTAEVLRIYRERMRSLRDDARNRYVQIFKNVGEAAGASIEHLHSQLMALSFVPQTVAEEVAAAADYRKKHGCCVYCDLLERELADARRIVAASADFGAWCPFASRFPYEVCLTPRRHAAAFDDADDAGIAAAASLLRETLVRVEKTLPAAAYNYVLHTAPFDSSQADHYHWHMEILPRTVKAAGFEWGTGVQINPVAPERAAEALRGVKPE